MSKSKKAVICEEVQTIMDEWYKNKSRTKITISVIMSNYVYSKAEEVDNSYNGLLCDLWDRFAYRKIDISHNRERLHNGGLSVLSELERILRNKNLLKPGGKPK